MGILNKAITNLYGVRMKLSKLTGAGISIISNKNKMKALESFYGLSARSNKGEIVSFEQYKGKKILLVNLASQCGYTPQYNELEKLYSLHKDKCIILGFPSNDFGGQEPGTDEEIAQFCKINYGVTFPLFHKDQVSGENKQPVYKWLTNKNKNGWNDEEPKWNFYKYLVDEEGNLTNIFSSSVSPASTEILKAITNAVR